MCRVCLVSVIWLCWLGLGCSRNLGRAPSQGEVYVGPATLRLKEELGPRAAEVAALKHGDRVEIIARRRRFVKVRTQQGAEGWTDIQQLLTAGEIEELTRLARLAAEQPSQGQATVFGSLNVHTAPNRQAPNIYRIREGELVDVIDYQVAPRVPFQARAALVEPPQPVGQQRRPKAEEPKVPPPAPPKPPADWKERSGWDPPPAAPPKPVPMDDWTLVRLPNGRVGWSLARMLRMNIPDEVAQYSEGHRITSYFSLGQVEDGGQIKHHWLWTTLSRGLQPYHFDSFRYFRWSTRSHRYETAYIERRLKGYLPARVHPVEVTSGKRTRTMPGFSLMVEEADGRRYRRTYVYESYVVRLISKTPVTEAAPAQSPSSRP